MTQVEERPGPAAMATDPAEPSPTPRAGWREPPDPRAVLRAVLPVPPAAIEAASLHDLSRSHALTYAMLPDGTAYVVKCLPERAHAEGRSLAAELYAYRLATWTPGLAPVLPEVMHLDERRQVVVLAAAPMHHLFPAQALQPGFPSPALAAALGEALAAVHTATSGLPLLTVASCGVLFVPATPVEHRQIGAGSAAGIAVTEAIAADATLAATLTRCVEVLRPSCLVHADLKWDNLELDPGPPARVRLFDWELSGRGDPAWDVGSVLADTVSLTVRERGLAALPADPVAWLDGALQAFLHGYVALASPGEGFAARVAGCWTGRLAHLAIECAAATDDAAHPAVRDLLDAARVLAGHEEAVTVALGDALAAQ